MENLQFDINSSRPSPRQSCTLHKQSNSLSPKSQLEADALAKATAASLKDIQQMDEVPRTASTKIDAAKPATAQPQSKRKRKQNALKAAKAQYDADLRAKMQEAEKLRAARVERRKCSARCVMS